MPSSYSVRCLDAVYDAENGFIVLNLLLLDTNERRITTWYKGDFHYKGQKEVPDVEMRRTAKMLKHKQFQWVIHDDPKHKCSEKDFMNHVDSFTKRIEKELSDVSDNMANEQKQIARKLYRLGEEGKLDFAKMYDNESKVRSKLGLK